MTADIAKLKALTERLRFPLGLGSYDPTYDLRHEAAARIEELEQERDEVRALFNECGIARDECGYIGAVQDCIRHLNTRAEAAEKRVEELEKERDDALAKYRKELGERLIGEVAVEANLRAELHAAWKRMEDLTRTIAARDRRIGRLVWAMDYAREKGVKFPADDEPPIVHGDQS